MEVCRLAIAPRRVWSNLGALRGILESRLRDRFAPIRATVRFGFDSSGERHLSFSTRLSRRFKAREFTREWRECRVAYRVTVINPRFSGRSCARPSVLDEIDTMRNPRAAAFDTDGARDGRDSGSPMRRHGPVSKSIYHACPRNYVFICKDPPPRDIRRTRPRFDGRLIILDAFPSVEQREQYFISTSRLVNGPKIAPIRDFARVLSIFYLDKCAVINDGGD